MCCKQRYMENYNTINVPYPENLSAMLMGSEVKVWMRHLSAAGSQSCG